MDDTEINNAKEAQEIFQEEFTDNYHLFKDDLLDIIDKIEVQPFSLVQELDSDSKLSISENVLNLYHNVGEMVKAYFFNNEELNSTIQCVSLDSSETNEPQNVVSVDLDNSSMMENDSSYGAFDTIAQATTFLPRLSPIKNIEYPDFDDIAQKMFDEILNKPDEINEIIEKAREVEIKEFKDEIIQRTKKPNIKILEVTEMVRKKEILEMIKLNETPVTSKKRKHTGKHTVFKQLRYGYLNTQCTAAVFEN